MIIRKLNPADAPNGEDGWMIAIEGEREVLRFKPPKKFTMADVETIREQLLKIARETEHGEN